MTVDRGVARTLNGVCGTAAALAILGVGFVAYQAKKGPVHPRIGSPRLQEARRRAAVAERVGDLAVAEREYGIALVLQPESASLRTGLARVYLARGKRAEALAAYRSLVGDTKAAADVDSLAWYGDLARERGDLETARKAYRRAVEIPVRRFYSETPLEAIERPESLPAPRGTTAQRLDADALEAHLRAGRATGAGVAPLNAEKHLRRALEIQPRSVLARLALARLRFDGRRSEEGLALLEEARRLGRPGRPAGSPRQASTT